MLVYGSHEPDKPFADALRRAATRVGGKIVAEEEFTDTGTARRTDTGKARCRCSPRRSDKVARVTVPDLADEAMQ